MQYEGREQLCQHRHSLNVDTDAQAAGVCNQQVKFA